MARVRLIALIAVSGLCLAGAVGCAGSSGPGAPTDSGVSGQVTVDLGCPVVHATPCPTEPLRARVIAVRQGSTETAGTTESGSDGHFRLALPPGRYLLTPQNLTGAPVPTAMPVTVDVPQGGFAEVTLAFDSGVRGPS